MKIIDAHTHVYHGAETGHILFRTADEYGYDKINVLSLSPLEGLSQNMECIYCKKQWPDRTFAFGGLEYQSGRSFAEQVRSIVAMGFDGVKMIEGKPTFRKVADLPLDSPEYDEFYAFLEEQQLPLLMHVADPEDFWDWDKIPQWAKDSGWFYDERHVPYRTLKSEVERLLNKHPRLPLILAHFYFLSESIGEAGQFLEQHPNVCFDLTSGSEMYINFSKAPDQWREFFHRYAGRLLFGTDSTDSPEQQAADQRQEINTLQLHFLQQSGGLDVGTDTIHGISLGQEDLEKIFHGNFERYAGTVPRPINIKAVQAELEILLATAEKMNHTEDAERLRQYRDIFRQTQQE